MDAKALAIVMARHDHPRVKAGLSWEDYIYLSIANHILSFCECVEIAHAVKLSPIVQAEIEVRCYARAGAVGAVERATARYELMFADRRGV